VSIIRKYRKCKIRIRAVAEQTAPGEQSIIRKFRKYKIRIRAGAEEVQDQDQGRSRADSSL
jgi:hypothetical protein